MSVLLGGLAGEEKNSNKSEIETELRYLSTAAAASDIKGALLFLKKFVQWFALVLITFKTYKQSPINRILPERARNFLYEYDIHFGLEAFTLRGHNLEKL